MVKPKCRRIKSELPWLMEGRRGHGASIPSDWLPLPTPFQRISENRWAVKVSYRSAL